MTGRRVAAPAFLLAAALFVPAAAPVAARQTADRAEIQESFLEEVVPALEIPIGWTGDVATCDAGAPSPAAQSATLTAINFVRGLAGLDPVSFDPALSAKAQQAALIMHANDDLDHDPPASWRCWTQAGDEAAGSSNLALGIAGADAILGYMDDDGRFNTAVGHRRWIMRPETATMGSGSTSGANALWIFGADAEGAAVPEWVPWPTAGYFPSPLEPEGRWSLSASSEAVTFPNATVTVTGPGGTSLPVQTYPEEQGFAKNTLVWEVSGVTIPRGDDALTYTVTVSGITRSDSGPAVHSYDVHLFSPPLTVLTPPHLGGRPRVGATLRVDEGDWRPDPESYSYGWLRDGVEIAGASNDSYRLTRADRGKTISVRVTAARLGYADGAATTNPTRRILRRR
ncbi:MAG: CAP domain-containing protein [Actinomycetota bacterium]|nr:CAP domain-containing protein [Actinomycetota bacterium]